VFLKENFQQANINKGEKEIAPAIISATIPPFLSICCRAT